jgi:ferric-dicitrate binding protein FerR (iron transport regulator)
MQEIDEQVVLLLYKRVSGEELEEEEHAALDSWLGQSAHHRALLEELLDEASMGKDVKALLAIDEDAALKKLQGRIASERRKARLISPVFIRYAAAAIIIAAAILGGYFIYGGAAGKGQVAKYIFPVSFKAVSTPRKKMQELILSDGTAVSINATSRLHYPEVFDSLVRNVIVEGEAFFEVQPLYNRNGQKIPFRVTIIRDSVLYATVEVLGTEFDVNAYAEEATIKTTLLKGKVLLQPANKEPATSLLPGQTAELDKNGAVQLGKADTTEITGWKNGRFIFQKKAIRPIMRMIERWYDVPVVFDTKTEISVAFTGNLSGSAPVADLLHIMEMTGNVHFTMKGDTIIVQNPPP